MMTCMSLPPESSRTDGDWRGGDRASCPPHLAMRPRHIFCSMVAARARVTCCARSLASASALTRSAASCASRSI
eukprot:341560-Pleurochrysis_carterae.AAC.3